jgi:2-oxoglutarate/2-oxoacid ferredoxin oxidoreductase subunit beta
VPAFNPLAVALAANASFVARGFAGDVRQLGRIMALAIRHRGFALVDILQPCVTYNHVNTAQWYKERVYDLAAERHDSSSAEAARGRAWEWPNSEGNDERIPVGVFYRKERPVQGDGFPALKRRPLVESKPDLARVRRMMDEFK